MIINVNCEYCNKFAGNCHKYQKDLLIRQHYKKFHKKELMEMDEVYGMLSRLQNKYKYYAHLQIPNPKKKAK